MWRPHLAVAAGAATSLPSNQCMSRPTAVPVLTPAATSRPSRPATEVSLTRVGVTRRREGDPRRRRSRRRRDHAALYFAELECFVDLNPHQAGVHMSRFEEVVNEAIDAVVLGETLRAEQLAAPHRRAGARAPGGPARRGHDRRPLPGDRHRPGIRHPHPGDLHALRHRGRLRARHPHAHRRRGPGHDRLPLRPGAARRPRPRAPRRATASTDDEIERDLRRRPRRHPQPARHRHAPPRPPRGLRRRASTPATCCTSSSSR